jgi:hypothetical protein
LLFLAGLSDGAGAGEMYLAKEINTDLRELLWVLAIATGGHCGSTTCPDLRRAADPGAATALSLFCSSLSVMRRSQQPDGNVVDVCVSSSSLVAVCVDGSAVIVWHPHGRAGVQVLPPSEENELSFIYTRWPGSKLGGDEGTGSGRCFLPWASWPRLAASVRPSPIVRRAAAMVVVRERFSSADPACSVRSLACCCCPFRSSGWRVALNGPKTASLITC